MVGCAGPAPFSVVLDDAAPRPVPQTHSRRLAGLSARIRGSDSPPDGLNARVRPDARTEPSGARAYGYGSYPHALVGGEIGNLARGRSLSAAVRGAMGDEPFTMLSRGPRPAGAGGTPRPRPRPGASTSASDGAHLRLPAPAAREGDRPWTRAAGGIAPRRLRRGRPPPGGSPCGARAGRRRRQRTRPRRSVRPHPWPAGLRRSPSGGAAGAEHRRLAAAVARGRQVAEIQRYLVRGGCRACGAPRPPPAGAGEVPWRCGRFRGAAARDRSPRRPPRRHGWVRLPRGCRRRPLGAPAGRSARRGHPAPATGPGPRLRAWGGGCAKPPDAPAPPDGCPRRPGRPGAVPTSRRDATPTARDAPSRRPTSCGVVRTREGAADRSTWRYMPKFRS